MKKLYVELANTPLKREQGLMGRKKMASNRGMLFNFPYPQRLSFWMSNTYIPLEIAFIDEEGVITEIKEMIPMNTRAITSKRRCKYALEVNRGWFKDNGVREGASVGGIGIKSDLNTCRIAQMTPQLQEALPVEPGLDAPPLPEEAPQQEPFSPDVVLNKTHQEVLEEADAKGEDLVVMYITKGGVALPPKIISPPFTFEEDAEGNSDGVVKAWDNQDGSWKSFLVDNIIDLEPKESPEKNEEILIQQQENQINPLN